MPKLPLELTSAFTIGCLSCGRSWQDTPKSPKIGGPCPTAGCESHDGKDALQLVFMAAEQHGKDSEPDHEVGDLQDALLTLWALQTPSQKAQFLADQTIRELLTHELGLELEVPASIEDMFVVIQEGGSSTERYAHYFPNEASAVRYRRQTSAKGAYRTSAPVKIDGKIAAHPGLMEVISSVMDAAVAMEHPDTPG